MNRVHRLIDRLEGMQWMRVLPINGWAARRARYQNPQDYVFEAGECQVSIGDWLADPGQTIFMETTITIPKDVENQPLGIVFAPSGRWEGLLSLNGTPYHGLDKNRPYIPLQASLLPAGTCTINIELYNPVALPLDFLNPNQATAEEYHPQPLVLRQSALVVPNLQVQSLLYTLRLYKDAADRLTPGTEQHRLLDEALQTVADQVLTTTDEELSQAAYAADVERSFLESVQRLQTGVPLGTVRMVGQSHIDTAWLWPIRETVRKCSRTFSTACTLLDLYPEFIYAQSQPQLYEYVKTYYPDLYARIKEKVAEGRWEIVGGMWVEPDLNMPSGESLVRQLLLGRRFFAEEFGASPRIEWLPDTFGYCASLPQLLKKSGMDYFMTTKMNWSDTNPFPYDLFYWVGIDGTKVLSFLNHGLNEHTLPKDVGEHWDSFKQKTVHPDQMLLYGHGDGGGGVTREMVEYVNRSAQLPGLPATVHSTAHDFFDGIAEANPRLPEWVGDLYLELHRGTYTTHARTKRNNRKAEVLYREAEIWNAFANTLGHSYPAAALQEGWKRILVNQFHDIIPGSSIHEVYVKSESDYQEAFGIANAELRRALDHIAGKVDTQGEGQPYLVMNGLSWKRDALVSWTGGAELCGIEVCDAAGSPVPTDLCQRSDGSYELSASVADIPAFGYTVVRHKPAVLQPAESVPFAWSWETPHYAVEWNRNGEMVRLFDKSANRDVIAEGSVANELQFFHDLPTYWDAWDVDPRFESQRAGHASLKSAEVVLQGRTKDVLRFRWDYGQSEIVQDVVFYRHSRRIDFQTTVDWHEEHKLLKVAFPVDVLASVATYEIPFGSVERATHTNTSWEQAQFEVCGHRWADLSDAGYGVTLMNDCKYGYDVKRNVLRLSLLRSPKWPDPEADQGRHEFTYSLYPHEGGWRQADIVREGFDLNDPVLVHQAEAHAGHLSSTESFLDVSTRHVVVDTIKQSEDGGDLILRLYESAGGREAAGLRFGFHVQEAHLTNLLEENESGIPLNGHCIDTALKPYEVQTVKLSL